MNPKLMTADRTSLSRLVMRRHAERRHAEAELQNQYKPQVDTPMLMSKYSLMARPSHIETDKILEVARKLFMEIGPGVTTAEIAREMGISEGSIFKRFPTKQSLMLAALGVVDPQPLLSEQLDRLVGQGELKENLVLILIQLVSFIRQLIPRLMLAWSSKEVMSTHLDQLKGGDSPPRRVLDALAKYLEQEMHLGRLRRTDPEVAARIFLGTTWNQVFLETIEERDKETVEPDAYARTLVDAVWHGLAPGQEHDGAAKTTRGPSHE